MESVRPATSADLARCAELLGHAAAEAGAQRGGAQLLGTASVIGAGALGVYLDDRDRRSLLVGEFEGAVVGVAAGRLDDPSRGRVLWCYVEEGARGVGVGTALVADLARWFTEAGCTEMEAVALPGDRSTKQLYEASGLKARLLVMHRSLP
jgi:GNAT superfamily N-acetyltransferase